MPLIDQKSEKKSEVRYRALPFMTPIVITLSIILIIMMMLYDRDEHHVGLFTYTPHSRSLKDLRYAGRNDVVLRIKLTSAYAPVMFLDGQKIELDELGISLRNKFKQTANKELYISAENMAEWRPVVHAIDIAHWADPDIRCILIHDDEMKKTTTER